MCTRVCFWGFLPFLKRFKCKGGNPRPYELVIWTSCLENYLWKIGSWKDVINFFLFDHRFFHLAENYPGLDPRVHRQVHLFAAIRNGSFAFPFLLTQPSVAPSREVPALVRTLISCRYTHTHLLLSVVLGDWRPVPTCDSLTTRANYLWQLERWFRRDGSGDRQRLIGSHAIHVGISRWNSLVGTVTVVSGLHGFFVSDFASQLGAWSSISFSVFFCWGFFDGGNYLLGMMMETVRLVRIVCVQTCCGRVKLPIVGLWTVDTLLSDPRWKQPKTPL